MYKVIVINVKKFLKQFVMFQIWFIKYLKFVLYLSIKQVLTRNILTKVFNIIRKMCNWEPKFVHNI